MATEQQGLRVIDQWNPRGRALGDKVPTTRTPLPGVWTERRLMDLYLASAPADPEVHPAFPVILRGQYGPNRDQWVEFMLTDTGFKVRTTAGHIITRADSANEVQIFIAAGTEQLESAIRTIAIPLTTDERTSQ